MKWEEVKHPVKLGGLGLRSLTVLNKSTSWKMGLGYWNEKNSLWKKIIDAKWVGRGTDGSFTLANKSG